MHNCHTHIAHMQVAQHVQRTVHADGNPPWMLVSLVQGQCLLQLLLQLLHFLIV